jgi:hypothetical protein
MTKPPAELAAFAFLIGSWRCEAKAKTPSGEWQTFHATWEGRFILDGYAVADEYRMLDAAGETIVFGLNLRVYDAARQRWNIKWLDAPAGTWLDLGPEKLGGISFEDGSISYAFEEPMAGHAPTRATSTNISDTHFTWRGEKSDDGRTWSEFMIIEAYRAYSQ